MNMLPAEVACALQMIMEGARETRMGYTMIGITILIALYSLS